jgi:hypothetical protein
MIVRHAERPWLLPAVLLMVTSGCARGLVGPELAQPLDTSRIETSVYLIGDGGNPSREGEPVLAALSRAIARDPEKNFVVILGDNVYEFGLDSAPDSPNRPEQERRLDTQLNVLFKNHVSGIVVPGNHDWQKHKATGLASVRAEEEFVRQRDRQHRAGHGPQLDSVSYLPSNGCPGPAVVEVGRGLQVLVLDTQWWLHKHARPNDATCGSEGAAGAADRIRQLLAAAGPRRTLVVAHHPIETAGEHGGFFDWKRHLFPLTAAKSWLLVPLPGLGSMYPLARMHGVSEQDVSSPLNCRMRAMLDSAFVPNPPLLYAAGHDHGLEVFEGGPARYSVVSGGGIFDHTNPFGRHANSLLSLAKSGFMRLDVMRDGSPPRLGVQVVDSAGQAREVFALQLDDSLPRPASAPRSCRRLLQRPDVSLLVPGREN